MKNEIDLKELRIEIGKMPSTQLISTFEELIRKGAGNISIPLIHYRDEILNRCVYFEQNVDEKIKRAAKTLLEKEKNMKDFKYFIRELEWTDPRKGGANIRTAVISNSVSDFIEELVSELLISDPPIFNRSIFRVESLSKILSKEETKVGGFITRYLEKRQDILQNSYIIIETDTVNISPRDIYLFGLEIVENSPTPSLQDFCKERNIELIFVFSEDDYTKYRIQLGMIAPGVRPIQTSDLTDGIRRTSNELKDKWYEEVRRK